MPQSQIPLIKGDKTGSETDYRDGLPINMYAVQKNILGAAGYMQNYSGISEFFSGNYTHRAKTVIFDFANNYGDVRMAMTLIQFLNVDQVIPYDASWQTYATSESSASFASEFAFTGLGQSWMTSSGINTNQRLIAVLPAEISFNKIQYVNAHFFSEPPTYNTDRGCRGTKIHITEDDYTDVTYDAVIPNSELIFEGTFLQHPQQFAEFYRVIDLF